MTTIKVPTEVRDRLRERTYDLAGYRPEADDEAEAFVLSVVGPHLPVEQIATRLADHFDQAGA